MNAMIARALLAAGLVLCCAPALAADRIESRPLQFAEGTSSATVKGGIRGDQIVDYKLRAKAGQTMSVTLHTGHGANYFNLLPPGSKDVALFVGSSHGNEWSGTLPVDGEYTLRVYLMRSAARRNESARYTLSVTIRGAASPPATLGAAPAGDAKVRGTPYHATGKLRCAMGDARAGSLLCDFGVIRGKPGHAQLEVTPPGGFKRVLVFAGDQVSAGDAKLEANRTADGWAVDVNDHEHYQVPEAVIHGG